MAAAVLVTLLFLMPLFYYTPNVVLAAIIITAVIGLLDYQSAYKLWKVDKLDFLACLCSFFGVLFISVPLGLAIAVSWYFINFFPVIANLKYNSMIIYVIDMPSIFRLSYQSSRSCFMSLDQTLWFWGIYKELKYSTT